MTALIDDYISGYLREFDYYQEAAHLAALCCQSLLRRNGMRGIVTHRAKSADRLRDKITKRELERKASKKRGFKTLQDIRDDIIDLSGVRIALYFPADIARVATLLEDEFEVRNAKKFPEKVKPRPGKRFDGYHATHFHVTLREGNVARPDERYLSAIIEIQVASVLMHAWSEVEHDMIYKPLSGELSEEELAILDELNGLVLTGEIALERLQHAVEKRVAKENAKFSNRYELAAFLVDETRALRSGEDAELTMGDVGTLLDLLRAAELDQPNNLIPYLHTVRDVTESRPIADQLADVVLSERPDLYKFYAGAKPPISGIGRSAPQRGERLLGAFLARWLVLERFIRILAMERGEKRDGIILVANRKLLQHLIDDRDLIDRLDWVRRHRNRIVHDYGKINEAEINEALQAINTIIAQLQVSNEPQFQSAIAEALAAD